MYYNQHRQGCHKDLGGCAAPGLSNRNCFERSNNRYGDAGVLEAWPSLSEGVDGRDLHVTATPEFGNEAQADQIICRNDTIAWFYTNGPRSAFRTHLEYYGISELARTHPDPFIYNTFGCLVESPQLKLDETALRGTGRSFNIRIHSLTEQTPNPADWLQHLNEMASQSARESDWDAHCCWWNEFWDRGWIVASDNTVPVPVREIPSPPASPGVRGEVDGAYIVSQSYSLQRFMMACQSRGRYQTQFNGGILQRRFLTTTRMTALFSAKIIATGEDALHFKTSVSCSGRCWRQAILT